MTFKAYDIFSSLVPGFLLLLVLQYFLCLPFDKDYIVGYIAIAFLLGYIMNAVGSWFEDIYVFSWGGKPSSNLLRGKSIWKIKFYNYRQVRQHLMQKSANTNPNDDELFAIAMRDVASIKDTRIDDFNAIYAFARTMLTTSLIGGILILTRNYTDWQYYIGVFLIILVLWYRCKQRGYYYAKEILNVYCRFNNI